MALPNMFSGMFGSVGGTVWNILKSLLYIIPVFLVVVLVILKIRSRNLFRYMVRVFRIRENGKVKEINLKGGFVNRQGTSPYFKIKTGWFPHQCIDLLTTPEVKYMDEEDRVYYLQIDVDTFVQLQRKMDITSKVTKDKDGKVIDVELNKKDFSFIPVESDIRFAALMQTQRIKALMAVEPTWKKVLPYFGLLLCAIVLMIGHIMNLKFGR